MKFYRPTKKVKTKRKINWVAIQKMVDNPHTPKALRKHWKKRLEEHLKKIKAK